MVREDNEKMIQEELEKFASVDRDVSFTKMTTLRIGGLAKYVVYPENQYSLSGVLNIAKENNLPVKVFGKGSNILCSDHYYDGIIIRLDRHFNHFYFKDNLLVAEAGCSIIALAHEALKRSLSGLEFASGIPATVGGVTFMNAGAYKSSMSDVIQRVCVFIDGEIVWLNNEECKFEYRKSIFQQHLDWIILAVEIKLEPGKEEEIRELMENRRQRRYDSQPLDKPSAGSVFRNPEEVPAWKLIEGIGYRGKKVGDAKVSEKHVNFLINDGEAKADDFLQLIEEIQKSVKDKYDIDLYMEVEKFNW